MQCTVETTKISTYKSHIIQEQNIVRLGHGYESFVKDETSITWLRFVRIESSSKTETIKFYTVKILPPVRREICHLTKTKTGVFCCFKLCVNCFFNFKFGPVL